MYSSVLQSIVLPAIERWSRSEFWSAYQRMCELESAPLEELQRLQWQRFEALLRHSYEHVPFHRERMDALGITPDDIKSLDDLHRLPISTKTEVQTNFPDRVSAEGLDRSDWQYVSTSGTANRLMVIQDFFKRDMVRAATTRSLRMSGDYRVGKRMVEIPPDICNIVCGAEGESLDGVWHQLWTMSRHRMWNDPRQISSLRGRVQRGWILRKNTYQPFGPQGTNLTEEHMKDYVEALRRDRPFVLKALPTYLYEIANYVVESGLPPLQVNVIKPMGSSVTPEMRATIEAGFSGSYREEYGSAEFGDMACDCDQRDGLHVFLDLFVIEVVRDGKSVGDGELGRVLITDLSNRAMPLIRYEIGDVGRLMHTDHGCGRHAPRLFVEGRLDDTIVTRSGRVFSSDEIMDFFYAREDISQFQLLEKRAGKMELLVVPSPGHEPSQNGLRGDLLEFLGDDAEITVYPVKTIKPEASGKFRFVQSSSFDRFS